MEEKEEGYVGARGGGGVEVWLVFFPSLCVCTSAVGGVATAEL